MERKYKVDMSDAVSATQLLLSSLGVDTDDEGLRETPRRVARFWAEFLNPPPIKFTTFDSEDMDEMVVVENIHFWSVCEHHLCPFFGVAAIGYIPRQRIVGLSKLPRCLEYYAHGLQNQERLTSQVAERLSKELNPLGVGVVVRARHSCFDEKTDILTPRGFIRFSDLRASDKVAQYWPASGLIDFVKPTSSVAYEYNGNMVSARSKMVDMLLTPDHRCLVRPDWSRRTGLGSYGFIPASDLSSNHRWWIPKAGLLKDSGSRLVSLNGRSFPIKDFAAFMGAYLSEGSLSGNRLRITQRNFSKGYYPYKALLDKLGLKYSYDNYSFSLSTRNGLHSYFEQFGKCKDKFVPAWILNGPLSTREAFLDYFHLGDGNYNAVSRSSVYTTTSPYLAEGIQCLCTLSGRSSSLTVRKSGAFDVREHFKGDFYSDCCAVFKDSVSSTPYSGMVYCVSVPSSAIVVRREGKPFISGNCMEMRGVRSHGTATATTKLLGVFKTDRSTRQEFLQRVRGNP